MSRLLVAGGLVAAAAGGFLLGRQEVRLGVLETRLEGLRRALRREQEERERLWSHDTEFDHVADREREQRHRLAEEMRHHPLREQQPGVDESELARSERPPEPDDALHLRSI